MNLLFICLVFLYFAGCNARVVPLNFKHDDCCTDSMISENELTDESPPDEIEILGHSVPNIKQRNDLELLNSEDNNTSVLEISNRNASNLPVDLTSKEEKTDEESNPESTESLALSDLLDEGLNSTSEIINKNISGSFGTLQVNGTLNDNIVNLTLRNETPVSNDSSSLDLEQENNMEFVEIEEKIVNDTIGQNETSETFQVINDTNNTDNLLQMQPLSNDTNVFLSDAENITDELKSNNIASEHLETINDSVKTAGSILSGFEFLINSEVARNAAKAMEVFNFSDPLTDHIMEENEFHTFLPAFNAELNFDSPLPTDLNTTVFNANISEGSNEILAAVNKALPSTEETPIVLNQTESLKVIKDSSTPFNLTGSLVERNKTEFLNLVEKSVRNVTSEVSPTLENSEKIQLASESTILKENINGSVTNSSAVGVPECPPPGWCLFWFLSQDTCALNEHCLGSRICCRVRCSKTCIEV